MFLRGFFGGGGAYTRLICITVTVISDDMEVFSFTPRREISCRPSEFHCGNGTCIPEEWMCDRDINCVDGSDESDLLCGG